MESVKPGAGRGNEEDVTRRSAPLEGKKATSMDNSNNLAVELTRALTFLLSKPESPKSLHLYMQAFRENKTETVRLIRVRQTQHLPIILTAFVEQTAQHISRLLAEKELTGDTGHEERSKLEEVHESLCFLAAIGPRDSQVQELRALVLFHLHRFGESAEACSLALRGQDVQLDPDAEGNGETFQQLPPERRARLLVSRAAANFSARDKGAETCKDLGEAFGVHPASARQQFHRLLSSQATRAVVCTEMRQEAERGLLQYREAVLARSDLRSSQGVELLDPVITQLQALCHLEPNGGGRELRVRLADGLLLRGEFKETLSICSQLISASSTCQSYQNTVHVLRGYSCLLSGDHQGALEDFQAVIEHSAPHPPSCVRALCGRGLLRMLGGSHYLTALDYMTASRLQHQDAALAVRCLVPWNCRGLLCTVLLEQGRAILEGAGSQMVSCMPTLHSERGQNDQQQSAEGKDSYSPAKEGALLGVHALATLLMELEPSTDAPRVLAADALYSLHRPEEAHRLLLSAGHAQGRSPLLARLTLLQLHRGFLYDANQLLKKLIQCGDTSCLCPLLAVASPEDRALLQRHCHAAAERILAAPGKEQDVREAIAYLSIAIISSGGEATESLLARGRCYARVGQHKTAIFDFTAILREHTEHVQARCGRGFTYLMLKQQKECMSDVLAALQVDVDAVTQEILLLKGKTRKLVCDWLHQHCRANLSEIIGANSIPCGEQPLRQAFLIGGILMKTECLEPRGNLLYIDILIAKGDIKAAGTHLCKIFGQESQEPEAQGRWGVVEAWRRNFRAAAKGLSAMAESEPVILDFLLALVSAAHRKPLAQASAHEASYFSICGQWQRALELLTVAVRASGEGSLLYRRQRAACLARLGLHQRATSDLDLVVHGHRERGGKNPDMWAEDLCRRGRSLLLSSREEAGLRDFAEALEMHAEQALRCIEDGPGTEHLADCFLREALRRVTERQLGHAWRLTESGLMVDACHVGLRRLRARIKREAAGSCIVH
uniref:Tetratricopeptide repeat domain 34 n=1 Tax=Paramormyrops kingsleyae TaxID=1676925 RepID=A0A3B3SN19_9TELE|nr:tetratricopeptide repeat protein 34 [Paramormyrops kingsleyae]